MGGRGKRRVEVGEAPQQNFSGTVCSNAVEARDSGRSTIDRLVRAIWCAAGALLASDGAQEQHAERC